MRFVIEESDEVLTTHAGLALIGLLLEKTELSSHHNDIPVPDRTYSEISNCDVAYPYLDLLCFRKSDFDHIEPFREDEFFTEVLQVIHVPSSPTLRQRFDLVVSAPASLADRYSGKSARLLRTIQISLFPIVLGEDKRLYLPLDIGVSPFDNPVTKKEGVSRTYKRM